MINKAIRAAGPIEVHVIPSRRPPRHVQPAEIGAPPPPRRVELPGPRRAAAWVLAVAAPVLITVALVPLRSSLGLAGALLCALVAVVGVALLGGLRPALLATLTGVLAADFLYTQPLYSFRDLHIALVGTLAAGRKRGIATALLATALSAARAEGYDQASLGVDADSLTGAVRLYERVGFTVDNTWTAYKKHLR